jgi:hypothetical protein
VKQDDRNAHQGKGRSNADPGLQGAAPLAQEEHGRPGEERQHHGRDDQVIGD